MDVYSGQCGKYFHYYANQNGHGVQETLRITVRTLFDLTVCAQ